ncbi:Hypothetical_protein [Hexamita inflata]|uniref:Hypothetical_protein n=1 Tax=Hexamita inflata TaxID=28002 RepID=A0AA86NG28_9EUKA|nr:Hypothetical protein HINF_LOCUS6083 [Hexamita inflata]
MKSRFACVITGFCFMFLCMFACGITVMCIPVEIEYPRYYMDYNNDLDYWNYSNYLYIGTGIGLFMTILGFFDFLISCCFACAIRPEKSQGKAQVQEPVQEKLVQQPPMIQYGVQPNYPQVQFMPISSFPWSKLCEVTGSIYDYRLVSQ